MGKTISRFYNDNSIPVQDAVAVTLTMVASPFTVFTGSLIPPAGGQNNGMRVWSNLAAGDYTVKYNAVTQSDLSPLYIAGTQTPPSSTIAIHSINTVDIDLAGLGSDAIADNAITSAKILDNAITAAKLGTASIAAVNIVDGSLTKAKLSSGIFNAVMQDVSGWGPRYDGVTLGTGTAGLKINDNGVSTLQLADDAVTADKLGAESVTALKIGTSVIQTVHIANDAITTALLANEAIDSTKIGTGAVIGINIGTGVITAINMGTSSITAFAIEDGAITSTKIGTNVIGLTQLDAATRNAMTRFASREAHVSPEFSDNIYPFFDNIADAYASVVADQGTIIVHPGTYLEQVTLTDSVNIIGTDKTRCIIQWIPTATLPTTIVINAVGSADILISNLTIKATGPAANINAKIYGIHITDVTTRIVRLDNVLIKVEGSADNTNPDIAAGIYFTNGDFQIKNCEIEVTGGALLVSGTAGRAIGIQTSGTSDGSVVGTRIKTIPGTGTGGTSVGIFFETNTENIVVDSCVIDSDTYSFAASATFTPTIMNTQYKVATDSNVQATKTFSSTLNANVEVKQTIP